MTTVLQISDPHFGTERAPVVRALLDLAHLATHDLVILSGDITQRARGSQFRAARAFVDQLAAPAVLVIPGNHDIPLLNLAARIFSPYANYARAFGSDLEPVFVADYLLAIGVNTTRAYRHKNGELSPQQIRRVAERLQRAGASQVRIVVVHQPVLASRDSDVRNLLRGYRQAVPVWAAAGADIIMHGHIHLPYVHALRGTFPALAREMWAVQGGTAVSSRIRDGIENSINVIHWEDANASRQCTVERWDYHPGAARFECHTRHLLQLARPGSHSAAEYGIAG